MPQLEWSDALALGLPVMDDTHREFVDLLARVEMADDAALLARWVMLIDHTDDHFGREDQWMQGTGFSSSIHGCGGAACSDSQRATAPVAEAA